MYFCLASKRKITTKYYIHKSHNLVNDIKYMYRIKFRFSLKATKVETISDFIRRQVNHMILCFNLRKILRRCHFDENMSVLGKIGVAWLRLLETKL